MESWPDWAQLAVERWSSPASWAGAWWGSAACSSSPGAESGLSLRCWRYPNSPGEAAHTRPPSPSRRSPRWTRWAHATPAWHWNSDGWAPPEKTWSGRSGRAAADSPARFYWMINLEGCRQWWGRRWPVKRLAPRGGAGRGHVGRPRRRCARCGCRRDATGTAGSFGRFPPCCHSTGL